MSEDSSGQAPAERAMKPEEQERLGSAMDEWLQVSRAAPQHVMTVVWSAVLAAFIGGMLGVAAFAAEKALGLLEMSWEPWSWLVWSLVPVYALAGGGLFVYYGVHRGWARVTRKLVFDSGLAERLFGAVLEPLFRILAEQQIEDLRAAQKRIAKLCRKAVEQSAAGGSARGVDGLAAWIKRRFLRLMAPVLARVVRAAVDQGVTTVSALLDMRGRLVTMAVDAGRGALDDAVARARNLALILLVLACAIPPSLIAAG